MRKKEIKIIQDWRAKLFIIFYNFFGTDLWMHKQGVFYEEILYRKKTIMRLQKLFYKIKKVIEKDNYQKVIKQLKKSGQEYLQRLRKYEKKWAGKERPLQVYIPEEDTEVIIFICYKTACEKMLDLIEENTDFDDLLETNITILSSMHQSFRKELKDYGYIVRKEKEVKPLIQREKKNFF